MAVSTERISEIFLERNRDSASDTVEAPAVAAEVGSFIGDREGREGRDDAVRWKQERDET